MGRCKISSESDLDALLKTHPHIAAIPNVASKLRALMKSMPKELICDVDEVLCLVDSGSTVNAAWIEKHFPGYAALVRQTKASLNGDSATTACGKKLMNKGRCIVKAETQGTEFHVAFKDMETELPILSVRKMVKRNNGVRFHPGGGTITNRKTGRTLNFYEHDGVYFIKLKVSDPSLVIDPPTDEDFHRQGS